MGTPASRAAEALRIAERDPERSAALARDALRSGRPAPDGPTRATAAHALGLAARRKGDLGASTSHLRRAIEIADQNGLDVTAAEIRVSLVNTMAHSGALAGALREAERARPVLRGPALADLEAKRATVLMLQGRLDEALEAYRQARPVLRRAGYVVAEAHLCNDRGLLHCRRGELGAAEACLCDAERLYDTAGCRDLVTNTRQNLAVVAARRGDVAAALALFDQADAYFAELDRVDSIGLYDRCESLLAARLVAEARETAQRAIEALQEEGREGYVAEVRLVAAEAALLDGDGRAARAAADGARRSFSRQGRRTWVALARHLSLRASWLQGDRSPRLLAAARKAASELADAGFAVPAADARVLAAEIALELGRVRVAREELAAPGRGGRHRPVALRSREWHAEALLRLADGNRAGADAALRAGIRLLDRHRATLGATELRAYASAHVEDLARLGLHLALEDRRAPRVLAWAERWRAGALRARPARPPSDAELAADLAALRGVVTEIEQTALAGLPTEGLLGRQAALERAVRDRARHVPGFHASPVDVVPSPRDLAATLGDDVLIELVEDDRVLHAVVVSRGRATLHRLGHLDEVEAELGQLRFALRRLAFGIGSAPSRMASQESAAFSAKRLDDLLLAPVASVLGEGRLVVVPTGTLHALPWTVLPTCRGRVTVAPSACVWHRAASSGGSRLRSVVLVAGPGLAHAVPEVRALARRYPEARSLTAGRATCEAVCAALDGADLAHVAAHGRFRSDNPLFSSLQLADGPLTVYDLERLSRPPQVLVFSACDSALSAVRPGDELMGLTAALLGLGTRALVGSVFPVPDAATRSLMLTFHAGLRAGLGPVAALAEAQARAATQGEAGAAAAAAFVCFGAGHRALVT
jgi:tetratricopeptide (TPR) repeat protein